MSEEIENKESFDSGKLDDIQNQMIAAGIIEDTDQINWMAVRKGDLFPRFSKEVKWIEWGDNLIAKELHLEPALDRSMLMSPFNEFFTWQTTQIQELIEVTDSKVHFKTTNSEYMLFKGNMESFKSDEHTSIVQEFING